MNSSDLFGLAQMIGLPVQLILFLFTWSLFWKGLALWHASRKAQPVWFVILLVVNTLGILEISYLFLVLKFKVGQLFRKDGQA